MKTFFFLITALIAYGSLYPFDWHIPDPAALRSDMNDLLRFGVTGRGDLIGNLVLFVPFGLTGMLAFTRRGTTASVAGWLLAGGICFATLLQVAQFLLPTRAPSGFDTLVNAFGIMAGIWLARLRPLAAIPHPLGGLNLVLLLGACWPLAQLLPLIPTIDEANVRNALKPLFIAGGGSVSEGLRIFVAWLAALYLLDHAPRSRDLTRWLAWLPLATLAIQPFILGAVITLGELTGALAAAAIWLVLGRQIAPLLLGITLMTMVIATNLLPWEAALLTRPLSLLPFSGFLSGNMLVNAEALLEKVFLYGVTIWLLMRGGMPLRWSSSLVVLALLLQELMQTQAVNGTAEITDPLLAVVLGLLLAGTGKQQTPHRAVAPAVNRIIPSPSQVRTGSVGHAGTRHLPGLDGLRAIAALSVFAVHLQQLIDLQAHLGPFDLDRWLTNGNTGVALFFVLSGFLLALPFLAPSTPRLTTQGLRHYYLRRLARILPAYYLCLLGLVAIDYARGSPPSINNILSHLLFIYNINDWQILSINEPFWTLAVEVQFYLLLPLVIFAIHPLPRPLAALIALGLALAAYLANLGLVTLLLNLDRWPIQFTLLWPFSIYISGPDSFVLTYSTLGHLTYFLLGVSMASSAPILLQQMSDTRRSGPLLAESIFWVSAAAIFVILATPLDDVLQMPKGHYNWPYVPLLIGALILATPHAPLARRLLSWSPLKFMGVISYGIYIFHHPIQQAGALLMRKLGLDPVELWPVYALATLGTTIVVSTLSFLLLERPLMRLARSYWTATTEPLEQPRPPNLTKSDSRRPDLRADASAVPKVACADRKEQKVDDWRHTRVHMNQEHWNWLRAFADAQNMSSSGAIRFLANSWLHDDIGRATIAVRPQSNDPLERDERDHWCVVNLRENQLTAIETQLAALGLDLNTLVACLIEQQQELVSAVSDASSVNPS